MSHCRDLLSCLQHLADLGGPIREAVVEALLSPEYYEILITSKKKKQTGKFLEKIK